MIALDSNLFIYMLEAHPEFGKLAKEVFLAIEQTNLDGCASELTFMEILSLGTLTNKRANQAHIQLERLGIVFKPVTEPVLIEAARLRRTFRLGALDAIHLASALLAGCTQFITNDHKLLKKKVSGIELVGLNNVKEATLFPRDINRLAP